MSFSTAMHAIWTILLTDDYEDAQAAQRYMSTFGGWGRSIIDLSTYKMSCTCHSNETISLAHWDTPGGAVSRLLMELLVQSSGATMCGAAAQGSCSLTVWRGEKL